MIIRWSLEARDDVDRVADFAASFDIARASELEYELSQAPKKLLQFPRLGSRLSEFDAREVRELRFGRYLIRYEVASEEVRILRIFHGREDRASK